MTRKLHEALATTLRFPEQCGEISAAIFAGTRNAMLPGLDANPKNFMNTVEAQFIADSSFDSCPLPVTEWRDGASFPVRIRNGSVRPLVNSQSERNNYGERNFDFLKYRSSGGLLRYRWMRWRGQPVA
jgi:hypothetical protein